MTALTSLFLFCLILVPISASSSYPAVKNPVRGVVIDAETGQTIPYATISLITGNITVKSIACDVDGKFELNLDSPGKFSLIIQSMSYQSLQKEFTVNDMNSGINLGTIKLIPNPEKIAEVTVVGQKPLVRTEPDKIVYSVESDPESKTASTLEMLRKVPMVTVDGDENIQLK